MQQGPNIKRKGRLNARRLNATRCEHKKKSINDSLIIHELVGSRYVRTCIHQPILVCMHGIS